MSQRLTKLFYQNPMIPSALVGLSVGLLAALSALLIVYTSPLIAFGLVLALLLALYALSNLEVALIGLLAVVALLPFATLPFRLGFTPTLIETALGGFMFVYLFQWMRGYRRAFHLTPVSWLVIAFILLMIFAFVLGLRGGRPPLSAINGFVGLIAGIGLSLILADVASRAESLRRVVLIVLLAGGVSAAVGVILWALPDALAEQILNRLGRFGYPVGGVIRYREDGIAIGNERAIGTWIDPNAYGGFLLMLGALAAAQLFAPQPVLRWRWAAFGLFGMIGLALFLSDSRGAVVGLAAGLGVIALLRYRKLIWLGLGVAGLLLFLPQTQAFIGRFVAGVTGADLETQMRLGEYQDALRLIGRYPIFGVGFTGVPDIDLYIGFSSTYLTIAAYTGLVGLAAYLLTVGGILTWGLRCWSYIRDDARIEHIWLGLLGGICGALIGGIFDHFYFNPQFQATSLLFWSFIGLFLATTRLGWEAQRADA